LGLPVAEIVDKDDAVEVVVKDVTRVPVRVTSANIKQF
jgi:hypothetical protein